MEGDRSITIMEPGAVIGSSDYGDDLRRDPVEHPAYGTRKDRRGSERTEGSTTVGEWDSSFKVRILPSLAYLSTDWWVLDEAGREWNIEAISEVEEPRKRWIILWCVARKALEQPAEPPAPTVYVPLLAEGVPLLANGERLVIPQ